MINTLKAFFLSKNTTGKENNIFFSFLRNIIKYYFDVFGGNKNKIKGKHNSINILGLRKNTSINISGNNNSILIDKNCIVKNLIIHIIGDNHSLIIKDHCKIRSGEFWLEDVNCNITIGKNTTIAGAHIAAVEKDRRIIIGNDCMLSTDIEIRTSDSHSIIDKKTGNRLNPAKDIMIRNHVWIGARVIILKGVNIGKNSIISTGSIVTKNVSENSIYGGIPAKKLKDEVSWLRKRI